jgi:hypothetical protein
MPRDDVGASNGLSAHSTEDDVVNNLLNALLVTHHLSPLLYVRDITQGRRW